MSSNKKSRRKFIKNSALASSLFIIPRHVLGGNGYTAPSDKLNLAGIGLHGKVNQIYYIQVLEEEKILLHYVMFIKMHMELSRL